MDIYKRLVHTLKACSIMAACGYAGHATQAKIVLPPLFSNHMIVQQQTTMTFFGEGAQNKTVTLKTGWNNKQYTTTTDAEGKWSLQVTTPKAGGPYKITISDGEETVLENVMAGEVWFCSGQSNMEMPLAGWGKVKNYEQEISEAQHPNIRLFQVKKATSAAPLDHLESTMGGWQECSPTTVPEFSALAYFYARGLQQKLKVPVGVIDCTWGGTPAESWTSAEGLKNVMGFQEQIARRAAVNYDANKIWEDYNQDLTRWKSAVSHIDRGALNNWTAQEVNDNNWSTMQLPAYWESKGLPGFDGVVWFRKTIELPASWEGKEIQLNPGIIDDEDVVYWNGQQIAQGSGYTTQRHYTVPAQLVKAGKNSLTIKVFDTGGEGGIAGEAAQMNLQQSGQATISLAGTWKYSIGCSLQELPKMPLSPHNSSWPSTLFNGMVHPCLAYPIKGVIWYQGCNNVGYAEQYESLFQALITDWRKQFNNPDMPFYFVQLANFLERKEVQADSPWAALRNAQAKALHLANTGMVVNIDIGEAYDIHPKNKQEVGRRLSALALGHTYGKKVVSSAPVYQNYEVIGKEIHIRFTLPAYGENFASNASVKGFTVAGPDRQFYPAQARTEGDKVIVTCNQVDVPVAVRYGWADNPECTLHTPSGFPVAPFRSDDW